MLSSLVIGCLIGLLTGLIPGLHSNLVLVGVASIAQVDLITIITAYGCSLYTHRLSHVFHPTASLNILTLPPAQRMMHKGKGPMALKLMLEASKNSTLVLTLILCLSLLLGFQADSLKVLTLPIIIGWLIFTVVTNKKAGKTFIGFCLSGTYGYHCLHNPSLRGSEFGMLIALNGLIAIPIIIQVFHEKNPKIPHQIPAKKVQVKQDLTILGTIIGMFASVIAGLGSSSLVTLFSHKTETDEEYIYLAACAETANNLLAFLLVIISGAAHSGEAVLIKLSAGQQELGPILIVWLAISMFVGYKFTTHIANDYVKLARQIPVKWSASLVGLVALVTVYMSGHIFIALIYITIGTTIALWCKEEQLPNQVMFGCLILPVLVNQLGLVTVVNKLLLL